MNIFENLEASSTKSERLEEEIINRSSFDQMKLSFMVGVLAISLPIALAIYGLGKSEFHRTISHFYYSDQFAEEIFVGILVGLGLIMLAYEGFSADPKEAKTEAQCATAGGFLAIGVAFFPTDGWIVSRADFSSGYRYDYYDTVPKLLDDKLVGYVHLGVAAALFAILAYFCLKIFTREHYQDQSGQENKRKRNFRYKLSGYIIVACLIGLAVVYGLRLAEKWTWWNELRATFVVESIMLFAFGYSWLVKSRFYGTSLLDPNQERARRRIMEERSQGQDT